jgi:hypothetical protein
VEEVRRDMQKFIQVQGWVIKAIRISMFGANKNFT